MSYKLVGSYIKRVGTDGYVEYVGSVGAEEGATLTILTVGVEDTPEAIVKWLKDTIKMMRDLNRDDVQAPDKYDRLGTVTGHVQTKPH